MKLKRIISLFAFFLFFIPAFSQKKGDTKVIEIVNADQVKYDQKFKDAQRLKGNVILLHEGTYMYCDSAMLFSKQKRFQAYGHIHVKRGDSLNIFGDSLHYFATPKLCKLWGNIRLVEKDLQLSTDSIQFNGKENTAWYTGGATITSISNGNKLYSKKGTYYSTRKTIYFKENVKLTGKDYSLDSDTLEYRTDEETSYFHGPTVIRSEGSTVYCESGWYDTKQEKSKFAINTFIHRKENFLRGDSILYDQKNGIGNAFGNVQIEDTLNDFLITGEKAFYNEKDNYFRVTECPLLHKYLEEDTLFVYADTLEALEDTINSQSWLKFYHRVKFFKRDLQGKCDSLYYTEADSLMRMFGDPVIWSENNQLTADSIVIKTFEGKVFGAEFRSNCFVIAAADTVGYHQVKGKNIKIWFKNEEVNRARVSGNAQCIYYAGEKGKPYKGMNKTDCSVIMVYFKDEEPKEVTFLEKPDAVFYPMDKIPVKDRLLKDFNWRGKERPLSAEDLFPID